MILALSILVGVVFVADTTAVLLLVTILVDSKETFLKTLGESSAAKVLQGLLHTPRKWVNRRMGPPLERFDRVHLVKSYRYIIYLVAAYYVVLPTLVLLLLPTGVTSDHMSKNTWIMVVLFHVWIGSNVIGDVISFAVSRNLINKVCGMEHLTGSRLAGYCLLDLIAAGCCLFGVMFLTNTCHAVQTAEASTLSEALGHGLEIERIQRQYSIRIDGVESATIGNVMLCIAVTTYIPTVVFAFTLFMGWLAIVVHRWVAPGAKSVHTQLESGKITGRDFRYVIGTIIVFLSTVLAALVRLLLYALSRT